MSNMINIRRDVQDTFYRYKMPRLQSKIEGKGNGIKTVIPNMSDIAKALARPALYTTKYFGFELGAQVIVSPDVDRYIVNGAHDAGKLQDCLDGFIDKFVLCKACKNPETELVVNSKTGDIIRDCKACGKQTPVDLRHKLANVIVKNPPEKKKKSKKDKAAKKKEASDEDDGEENGDIDAGSDDELTRSIQMAAAQLPANGSKDDDVKWSVDTSEAAVKARVAGLADGVDKLVLAGGDDDDDDDAGGETNYDVLGNWIEENKATCSDIEIYKKAQELEIESKHKTLAVLVQCLLDKDILKQIPKHAPLFSKLKTSDRHEKALLGGLERVVGQLHPELLPGTSKILMILYEHDLLTEPVVEKWGAKASKKYVDKDTSKKIRKAAEPFLQWLAEAESDEDDSDEEDDEDDDE
ncbi:eukaryotic translation initiation factor 5 [Savitreella phatthalungensis]